MSEKHLGRRRVLQLSGSALAVAIAGCSGEDGGDGGESPTTAGEDGEPTMTTVDGETTTTTDDGETTTTAGEETTTSDGETTTDGGASAEQAVDDYLTTDPAAGNYDGSIVDETGSDEVVVKVGAEGNDGNFAFEPAAVRISSGTTVKWEWTGQGGQHNVVSDQSSDFDFTSGDPKTEGEPFQQSFDETGAGLYYCAPHESLGMKGAFEVVE